MHSCLSQLHLDARANALHEQGATGAKHMVHANGDAHAHHQGSERGVAGVAHHFVIHLHGENGGQQAQDVDGKRERQGLAVGVAVRPEHFAQPVLLGLRVGQRLQIGVAFGVSVGHKVPTPMHAFFNFLCALGERLGELLLFSF